MASTAFDSLLSDLVNNNVKFGTTPDTFYIMLTTGYTPNKGTHAKRSDVTGEVTGTAYTAGGQAIVPTTALDTTNHRITLTFPAVSWASSTISATGAVVYKRRGGAATADELVYFDDFGATVASSNGTFTVNASTVTFNTPA